MDTSTSCDKLPTQRQGPLSRIAEVSGLYCTAAIAQLPGESSPTKRTGPTGRIYEHDRAAPTNRRRIKFGKVSHRDLPIVTREVTNVLLVGLCRIAQGSIFI